MKTPWIPVPTVPRLLDTGRLRLRPLTIHDAVKDFDAVMTSRAEIWELFGPGSGWPAETLSLEQDLIDLAWHQKEFEIGGSYTYTVEALDASQVLGCVYIFPPTQAGADADVFYWVRSSELAGGLPEHLWEHLRRWLGNDWGFKRLALNGGGIVALG
ncbi:GNAT family N-acetyltransferase [Hydrogenophaga sp.]|uniref:GNAT family N-acetyltransferase n=1 Tax=Hydrogenophaga sp. TaxID=1904254 RepID=UPI002618719C|nr:GNAT family N-acetyltransferase [Hydrogenophaga sp.]